MARRLFALLAVVAVASACGATSGALPVGSPSFAPSASVSTNSAPSSSPVTSPMSTPSTPLQPLVAVIDHPGLTFGNTLRLVTLDGQAVASVKATPIQSLAFVGGGGSRAVYLEETHADTSATISWVLRALHRDGRIETLQDFGSEDPTGIVLSPDGSRWLWTRWSSTDNGMDHSSLHLTTAGSDSVIATLDAPYQILMAYRWDAGGAIVARTPIGLGPLWFPIGYGAHGDVYLLDPSSKNLSLLLQAATCEFHARAADGTVACLTPYPDGSGGNVLHVGKPPLLSIVIPLNRSRFWAAGSISFKPGATASLLAIAGLSSPPAGGLGWSACYTDLVDVKGRGDIWRFGPDDLCPPGGGWGWLDDGSLIEMKPASLNAAGTATTSVTYVVSPAGSAREVTPGTPVGVLDG